MDKATVGIDIGTTTVSAVVVCKNSPVKSFTKPNNSWIITGNSFDKEQSPEIILNTVYEILNEIKQEYIIDSIGVTGQMHGIVFVDNTGNAVSPLYTWQDEKSKQIIKGKNINYCDEILEITDEKVYSGYGFATCYYLLKNNAVPENAAYVCTIMDYIVIKLCNLKKPVIHPSNAASIGFFDNNTITFKYDKLNKAGLYGFIPDVTPDYRIVGKYYNADVFSAIGDNQASVYALLGTDESKLCVNFGTGSQISAVIDEYRTADCCETRPYVFGKYLLCGSALCGGRAYAVLEKFFREYAKYLGQDSSQFDILNKLAEKGRDGNSGIKFDTRFCGTRDNIDIRGSISGLTDINFTPENIVYETIAGMVNELYGYYGNMNLSTIKTITASGNAVKRNNVLLETIENVFGKKVNILDFNEEAAYGVTLLNLKCGKQGANA